MRIQRDQVIATALQLLDEVGLDGLTMRVLAKALDIQAPSLYWHLPNKRALIDAMADAMLAGVARTRSRASWQKVLRMVAAELRHALTVRRDGARVFAGTYVVSDNVLRVGDAMIGALARAGASGQLAAWGSFSLLYFVLGFAMEEQGSSREGEPDLAAHKAAFLAMTEHAYPATFQVADKLFDVDFDQRFEFGLDLLIAGLERRMAA